MEPGKFRNSRRGAVCAAFAVTLLALAPAAQATTYTWTGGGGANHKWSNAANWGGSGPDDNETGVALVFPALAGHYASDNDLTGLHVASLAVTTQLSDGSYLFTGNAIALSGPTAMSSPGSGNPNLVWQVPLALEADVTIGTSGRQTQIQGPIDLGSHTLTLDAGGDVVLAGVVSGSGNLIKNNSSALTITGSNTYTGSTTGNRGALYISSAAAFGATGTGTTFNGGFLGFAGNAFTTSEPFVFSGGGILAYGEPIMAGPITLATTTDVKAFEATTVLTIVGTIGGAGGVRKSGPGLLILNAAGELYEGATEVGAGTLRLDSELASTNPVTVRSGASLAGNGSAGGAIEVEGGGRVAPGTSPGRLESSGLSMDAGAILAVEIDGASPGTQYDTIDVSGPVGLGGATLTVTLGFTPADGQQFTLVSQLQGGPVSGTFAALDEGSTFQVGGTTFGITYEGGTGNDVVLVAGATPAPTRTPTEVVPVGTPSSTPSDATPTPTGAAAATSTPSPPPSPTTTGTAPFCAGDCGGDVSVTVDEIVFGVGLALDDASTAACPRFETDADDRVTLPELLEAIDNALRGCAP